VPKVDKRAGRDFRGSLHLSRENSKRFPHYNAMWEYELSRNDISLKILKGKKGFTTGTRMHKNEDYYNL